MKPIAFCLLFAFVVSYSACAQSLDDVAVQKISDCIAKCDTFLNFKNQRNSPLPDDLARCLEDAVNQLEQAGPAYTPYYAISLFYHSNQMANTGYLRKAVGEFQAVDSIIQQSPESFPPAVSGHINIQLSILYQRLYEMDKALVCGEKALAEYHSLKMYGDEFDALVNRGVIALAKGNTREGQYWAEKALAQWKTIPAIPASQRLNRLSAENLKYACLIDLADSLAFEQGQRVAQPQYRAALNGLRGVLHEAAAFDTLTQDVRVATGALVANIQTCFSNLRAAEHFWADSILWYHRLLSEKGVDSTNARPYFGVAQAQAALAYAEKKQWEDAYALSVKSCQHYGYPLRDIFDRTPFRAEQVEQKQNLVNVLRIQAKILEKRKSDRNAQKQALFVYDNIFTLLNELRLQFASESSMELSTERFVRLYHEAAMAAIELYRQTGDVKYFEKAFQYAEQGKSFTLRNALRRQVNDPALAANEKRLLANVRDAELLQKKTARLYEVEKAHQELQAWREQVKKEYPSYFAEQISEGAVEMDFVRRKLVDNDATALIEFSTGSDSTLLLAVTKSKTYWDVVHHPSGWSKTLDDYGGAIFSEKENFIAAGHKIYQVLLANLLERQLPKGINRLVLVLDGRLREVVFESLLTKPAKVSDGYGQLSYLSRYYDLSYQYSLSAYKYAAEIERKAFQHPLGVFIGKYSTNDDASQRCSNDELKTLAAAAREIANLWGGRKPFEGATESEFRQEAEHFDELLFVMHGCIDSVDLLESSILFTKKEDKDDGRLTVREVLGLPKNLNARLAVFVSCNTARGLRIGGEGIISLARAFAYAGVPAVVAATAPLAEKEVSAELLKLFHQNMKKGMPKDRALAAAKEKLMNDWHPHYWANLILLGDPAPMHSR